MLPRQPLLPPLPLTSLLLLLLLLLPLLKVTRQSSASRPPTPPTWSPGSWSILENHNPVEDLYQEGILVNNNLRRSTGGSKLLRKLKVQAILYYFLFFCNFCFFVEVLASHHFSLPLVHPSPRPRGDLRDLLSVPHLLILSIGMLCGPPNPFSPSCFPSFSLEISFVILRLVWILLFPAPAPAPAPVFYSGNSVRLLGSMGKILEAIDL